MCRNASLRFGLVILGAIALNAQTGGVPALEWRRIGTTTLALGLSSPASGPVERVWYSENGATLYALCANGRIWQTSDGEAWTSADRNLTPKENPRTVAGATWDIGPHVRRSEDGGKHWRNLTDYRGESILGGRVADLAISPARPEEIAVATSTGVWRSADGGISWSGLNDALPNLPAVRLLRGPGAVRILTSAGAEAEWTSGERSGWRLATDSVLDGEKQLLARVPGASAAARSGDVTYIGTDDGRLLVSSDRGRTWQDSPRTPSSDRVIRIFAEGPAFAVAITETRVLRTVNRGAFWDDITSNVPAGALHGVAADRATGAVYLASSAGVFYTFTDTAALAPATAWTRLREEPANDVALDPAGNQLYVALEGAGVFATLAPHRFRDPRVVNAADRVARAAAPGSLLSVIGARVESAQAGDRAASILAAGDLESQVQLPWDLPAGNVTIAMNGSAGPIRVGMPVAPVAPAIFVDKEGMPLLLNADTGLMLDAGTPAHSRSRIQVLLSGLGRVTPNWPAGLPAPLQDPPRVIAPIRALLDRQPVEVRRATLAPGYAGMYLVEVELPAIVNRGPAEFYIEAAGEPSNRVRLWLEP